MTTRERLASKLTPERECLVFRGARNKAGYGVLRVAGRNVLAHRLAWKLAGRDLPAGAQVLHSCDNPPCCCLDHLFLGTDAENRRDMARKGRGRCGPLPYGVGRNGKSGYFARIYLGGKPVYLGTFRDPELAGEKAMATKEAYYAAV